MAPPPKIPDLGQVSSEPDKYTRKSPDMTGASAENRIIFINLGFFKYGTDDKAHAGAIFLSLLLLLVMVASLFVGAFTAANADWMRAFLQFIGSAFTLVAGVAIGRGQTGRKKKKSKPDD